MSQTAITAPDALAGRVDRMIQIGRLGAARPLIAALRKLGLAAPRIALLEAKIALREERIGDALISLDGAIAIADVDPDLRKCRAEARLKNDDPAGAAGDAAEAVIINRDDPGAKALLGVTLIELQRYDEARACLAEAVATDPRHPFYRIGLAEALSRLGRLKEAEAVLDSAVEIHPVRADLRGKAMLLRMRQRNFQAVIRLAADAKANGAADACVFGLMGHAYSSSGQHELAAEAYREALKLCPEDSYVRHLVAAAGAMPGAERAPPDYLRAVFDGYAERFEPHLITLLYRVPGLIGKIIDAELKSRPRSAPPLLDLGCGTGLVGAICADPKLGPMTGIDISPSMLAQARQKSIYAELIEADLPAFLDGETRRWPLVTAGDVFCYFGDLTMILKRLQPRMTPDGLLAFSVEELLPDSDGVILGNSGHALGRLGRYAHSAQHVRDAAAAACFAIDELRHEDLRRESDTPVQGMIVTLRVQSGA